MRRIPFTPILVHLGGIFPLAWLLWDLATNNLGINPIQAITQRTGRYAITMLAASLVCTPINILSGWQEIRKARRPFGLYAFLYAVLHALTFLGLDYGFNITIILQDTLLRKHYILAGVFTFTLLLILAITSFNWAKRRMRKAWRTLHRLAYVAGLTAAIHFAWAVKSDIRIPLAYGIGITILLLVRLPAVKELATDLRKKMRLFMHSNRDE